MASNMPDKKLTDNEIVKALECCVKGYCEMDDCPYKHITNINICTSKMAENALDLINRLQADKEALINGQETLQKHIATQKAEIERLKQNLEEAHIDIKEHLAEIERLKTNLNIELENFATEYDSKIKAEAYKEFAERLKKEYSLNWLVSTEDIDNLLKELVGDSNV